MQVSQKTFETECCQITTLYYNANQIVHFEQYTYTTNTEPIWIDLTIGINLFMITAYVVIAFATENSSLTTNLPVIFHKPYEICR